MPGRQETAVSPWAPHAPLSPFPHLQLGIMTAQHQACCEHHFKAALTGVAQEMGQSREFLSHKPYCRSWHWWEGERGPRG